ncbi:hypothetical protein EZS27_007373 [termite gut metagenome]|uniref:Uncharacterized protein n=1 Tax=termite gut metagenome TaxID=433724 RepID=A0A5J4SI77_9ZZZZ
MYFPIPQPSLRLAGVELNKARSLLEERGRGSIAQSVCQSEKIQVKQFYY